MINIPIQNSRIDIHYGPASPYEATVVVRPIDATLNEILRATIQGPYCEYANTLPAKLSFQRRKQSFTELLVNIPEPCYWTPNLPFFYLMEFVTRDLRTGNEQTHKQRLGLNRLAIKGKSFYLDGQRFVVRAIFWPDLNHEPPWLELRGAATALVVSDYDEMFYQSASLAGVMLIADCRAWNLSLESLRTLRKWPAMQIVLWSPEQFREQDLIRAAGQLVIGVVDNHASHEQRQTTIIAVEKSENRSSRLCAVFDYAEFVKTDVQPSKFSMEPWPILVFDFSTTPHDWQTQRRLCDELQAKLTKYPPGDFAGYLVF